MDINRIIGLFMMKYLAGNRKVEVIKGKKHIACIGDSITFGAGVKGKKEETWEYHLNEIIGDEYQVLNYGTNGRTLLSTGDYPYTADKLYQRSLECKADIYLIMLGSNDAKPHNWNTDKFEKEYDEFVRKYRELDNKPQVILMIPPHCFPDKETGIVGFGIDASIIDKYVEKIVKETAKRYGLQTIDLYSFSEGHDEWFVDGVHPNKTGNQKIAEYISSQLKL